MRILGTRADGVVAVSVLSGMAMLVDEQRGVASPMFDQEKLASFGPFAPDAGSLERRRLVQRVVDRSQMMPLDRWRAVALANPYHDESGRFTSAQGATEDADKASTYASEKGRSSSGGFRTPGAEVALRAAQRATAATSTGDFKTAVKEHQNAVKAHVVAASNSKGAEQKAHDAASDAHVTAREKAQAAADASDVMQGGKAGQIASNKKLSEAAYDIADKLVSIAGYSPDLADEFRDDKTVVDVVKGHVGSLMRKVVRGETVDTRAVAHKIFDKLFVSAGQEPFDWNNLESDEQAAMMRVVRDAVKQAKVMGAKKK